MGVPFIKGKNSTLKYFQNGDKVDLKVKTWEIEEDGTEIADGVNGEDRDNLDYEVNFYKVRLSLFQESLAVLEKFLDDRTNQDAGVQPLEKVFGLVIKPNDGSKKAFVLSGQGTVDSWKLSSGGRTDRTMLDMPMRFQRLKKVPI